ncbi:MAG: ribbon-helix-helix protein, CopG family, partial [Candidatus Methylomirabilales bacterium]
MRRKQLYIDDDLDEALKALAAATGKSEASHVREALRGYLLAEHPKPEHDPLLALIGLVQDDDAPDDLAEELDHYT